jgi:2-hydroxychromene-2-carboxylate isomerase
MTLTFDFFCSFRSPYSYLAIDRVFDIYQRHDVAIDVRLVYPFAVLDPQRFDKAALPRDKVWLDYLTIDTPRVAEFLGIPFHWPRPDPIVQDLDDGASAEDRPQVWSITRLGQAAVEAGRGLAFIDQVARIIWDGTVDGWDRDGHLAGATARAGLDLSRLEAAVAAETERIDAAILDNDTALEAAGHWGRPTMVFDGEPFFGQDRIEVLLWRMRQKGLTARP